MLVSLCKDTLDRGIALGSTTKRLRLYPLLFFGGVFFTVFCVFMFISPRNSFRQWVFSLVAGNLVSVLVVEAMLVQGLNAI